MLHKSLINVNADPVIKTPFASIQLPHIIAHRSSWLFVNGALN